MWHKLTRSTLGQLIVFWGMIGLWMTIWFATDWLHDYF